MRRMRKEIQEATLPTKERGEVKKKPTALIFKEVFFTHEVAKMLHLPIQDVRAYARLHNIKQMGSRYMFTHSTLAKMKEDLKR